jgi:hypothetical protein
LPNVRGNFTEASLLLNALLAAFVEALKLGCNLDVATLDSADSASRHETTRKATGLLPLQ